MSAAQTQKENNEVGWGGLEALGLSQRELVLAEALQMEYDALSRHKQDKSGPSTDPSGSSSPGQPLSKTQNPFIECPQPSLSQPVLDPAGGSQPRELFGSNSPLNQPGGSQAPQNLPPMVPPIQGGYVKDSPYILSPEISKSSNLSGSRHRDFVGSGSGFLSKGPVPPPDDIPPAIPPRNPIPPSSGSSNPFLPPRRSTSPRDVNLFMPDVDQPKVTSEDLCFDHINDSLSRLNEARPGSRAHRNMRDHSGKPVARSQTLPPQVPPRTYIPAFKSNKNQRRVSVDPVRT